ncbi:bifunctional enoyl-CoA hydratase/phosphate acetyltransferase [Stappia sp.]|uniref:bifunctional enoyl-CoA hydratase/phosphate acetyltransferase n=1 Tax=Stappia sp. TaxID=1870903 RepID=UPI003A9962FA
MDNRPTETRSDFVESRTFEEIAPGDSAVLRRSVVQQDIDLLAVLSGEAMPVSLAGTSSPGSAPGPLAASLVAVLLATELPGPGTVSLSQSLTFHGTVAAGDVLDLSLTVTACDPGTRELELACDLSTETGRKVASGTLRVRPPEKKVRRHRLELPDIRMSRHERFRALIAEAVCVTPPVVAVAHPCSAAAIAAAVEAAEAGIVTPILVGPRAKIALAAEEAGVMLDRFRLVDAPHSDAAAAEAVALVRRGEASLLMKGSLHTDELLRAVLARDGGLRTERRLSHVYLMDVPSYPRPLLITDAAVNIEPDLAIKRDIIRNAVDLARAMGIDEPKVAILSAVETVNPKLRSTLDAAALCKMADRGQITGALVEGPLAFDNAINPQAAREKGIRSPVAGVADILVVPDLEAGNILAKQLTFLAGADAAGVVLGARVPIILTSRADAERTRLASCAVAAKLARLAAAAYGKGTV